MDNQLQTIVNQSGLDQTKSEYILTKFQDYFKMAAEWEVKAKTIVVTDESQKTEMQMARVGRLFLREQRLKVEKARKEMKEECIREGKAIEGIANVLKALIEPIEEYLKKQEKFIEIKEAERKEARKKQRILALTELNYEYNGLDLINMSDDQFDVLIKGIKADIEAKAEAERKAEEVRLENERKEKAQEERKNKMFELGLKWDGASFIYKDINFHWIDILTMTDEEFKKAYDGAKARKAQLEKEEVEEQERIRKENEKLKAEAEKLKQKAKEEQEKHEAKMIAIEKDAEEREAKFKEQTEKEVERVKKEIQSQHEVECPFCHRKFSLDPETRERLSA